MFGLSRHLDDVAAQRARAVSIRAAFAVAAMRMLVLSAFRALGGFAAGARERIAWRLEPVMAAAHADLRWLGSVFSPVVAALALAAASVTVIAPAALIVSAASALVFPPANGEKSFGRSADAIPDYANFIERFRALNDTRWTFSDGWDNGQYMLNDWRRDTLHVSPQGLQIVMGPNPPDARLPLASGELQSHEYFQYGYFEVRMRIPRGPGTGVGFFTYTEPQGTPTWQEIDVEFVGSNTRAVELAYHMAGHPSLKRLNLPFDAADDFHTYGFEWTPEGIRWYVDNQLAREALDGRAPQMNRPQRLYLSLWSTTLHHWAGRLDQSQAPWSLYVTCVAQAREYRGESLCAN